MPGTWLQNPPGGGNPHIELIANGARAFVSVAFKGTAQKQVVITMDGGTPNDGKTWDSTVVDEKRWRAASTAATYRIYPLRVGGVVSKENEHTDATNRVSHWRFYASDGSEMVAITIAMEEQGFGPPVIATTTPVTDEGNTPLG